MRYRLEVAASKGISANSPPPPDGFRTQGVSTLYDADGEVKARWVKDRLDAEQSKAAMEETLRAFMEPLKGLAKPTKAPKSTAIDVMTEYVIADLHIGMYAYGLEAGEDYDSDIAASICARAIDRLIESAPASEQALINNLGDLMHMDSSKNETTAGTRVDVDTRFRRVVKTSIKALRYAIDNALKKHTKVRIRNTPGNHDFHAAMMVDEAILAAYENEPRVIVEGSPKPFWAYRFGSNLVGIGHGDAPKAKLMPGLLACDYPKEWAECEHRYCRAGHVHHASAFEDLGVKVETFRTLAPKDFWHAKQGYRSGREMQSIVLHKEFGEVERHTASIARIEA